MRADESERRESLPLEDAQEEGVAGADAELPSLISWIWKSRGLNLGSRLSSGRRIRGSPVHAVANPSLTIQLSLPALLVKQPGEFHRSGCFRSAVFGDHTGNAQSPCRFAHLYIENFCGYGFISLAKLPLG
jgi:hypothetical protein